MGAGLQVDIAVLEVSSYQLEIPSPFRPDAAVILNLTPDHLERHGSMEGYAAAKCQVFRNQSEHDIAFLPADDGLLQQMAFQLNPSLNLVYI
eukprot:scaffold451687_cov42-Prasinocladus_malaysianus.AAC.1